MRVLHIIPSASLAHGGPSQAIVDIERALAEGSVQVTAVTTGDDGGIRRLAALSAGWLPGLVLHISTCVLGDHAFDCIDRLQATVCCSTLRTMPKDVPSVTSGKSGADKIAQQKFSDLKQGYQQ